MNGQIIRTVYDNKKVDCATISEVNWAKCNKIQGKKMRGKMDKYIDEQIKYWMNGQDAWLDGWYFWPWMVAHWLTFTTAVLPCYGQSMRFWHKHRHSLLYNIIPSLLISRIQC